MKILIPVLILLTGLQLQAQDTSSRFVPKYERVMIVPLDMTYYLSDADHDIAKRSDLNLAQVQYNFRAGLNLSLGHSIYELYDSDNLLASPDSTSRADLYKLYGALSHKYARPFGMSEKESAVEDSPVKAWFSKTFKKGENTDDGLDEEGGDAYFEAGKVKPPSADRRYMRAILNYPEVLSQMYEKYHTDLFVFVNQFEIHTNYEHCLDRATGNFARELSLHYSIYNKDGRELGGDVVTVYFPSNNNNLEDIISQTFGQLVQPIVWDLPKPKYVRNKEYEKTNDSIPAEN